MKDKDLLKLLLKNGWQDVRQRGSYHRLIKGNCQGRNIFDPFGRLKVTQ